jgi:hypothetical protein
MQPLCSVWPLPLKQTLLVMKTIFAYLLLLTTIFSCQKEEMTEVEPYPQTWQLVKLTGQIPNFVRTGADLPWQETYVFNADSTFKKTRQQGDQVTEASGTFTLQDFSDGQYVVLTYNTASNIIGTCTPTELKETLVLETDDTLVSTWQACDGPGLEYKKVKQVQTK